MKFTTNKSQLQNALNIAGKALGKTTLPALENFLFTCTSGKLTVTGSNMETFISTSLPVEADSDFSIMIPAARLSGLIRELPESELSFTIEAKEAAGYNVTIKAGRGKYNIPAEKGQDYPTMQREVGETFTIPANVLLSGIEKTLFATSKDDAQPALTGMLLRISQGVASFTGCDKFVLSTFSFPVENVADCELVIPNRVLSILSSLVEGNSVDVGVGERNIFFQAGEDTTVSSVLVDAKYPDILAVIPVDNPITAKVNRVELTGALKRVGQFANSITNAAVLNFNGKLTVTASNTHGETADEEIEAAVSGGELKIGVNVGQVLSILNRMDGTDAYLHMSTEKRAIVFKDTPDSPDNKMDLMLEMPVVI